MSDTAEHLVGMHASMNPSPLLQREYEEFKVRMNHLAARARKVPEEGWIMSDGTPWPGNNSRDHPAMIQVIDQKNLSIKFPASSLERLSPF